MTAPDGAPAPLGDTHFGDTHFGDTHFGDTHFGDTHFGFRTVGIDHKQAMVDEVFDKVAPRYDLMNDLMSGGLHRVWKDILVTALNPPRNERSFSALDVAGGTGDVAFRIAQAGEAGTLVTVCDINEEMLAVGREHSFRESPSTIARTYGEVHTTALGSPVIASSWRPFARRWESVVTSAPVQHPALPQSPSTYSRYRPWRLLGTGPHSLPLKIPNCP